MAIKKLTSDGESETLEFKKSTSELKEGVISIAAILNKHQKGTLYLRRYTPQLCCDWDKPSINFNRKYIY